MRSAASLSQSAATAALRLAMASKASLIVQTVCFHDDDRRAATELGEDLYENLTRPRGDPLAFGPAIPVRLGTDPARALEIATERNLLVLVLGRSAHRDEASRDAVRDAIATWQRRPEVHLLPVLRDVVWRGEESVERLTPIRNWQPNVGQTATVINVVLAACRLVAADGRSPTIFVSHAKADLPNTKSVAEKIRDYIRTKTVGEAFFDTTDLEHGRDLEAQLAVATSGGILLAVRGDKFASRPWCVSEVHNAKRNKLAILTVEALESGEHRAHPYSGNGPTVVWRSKGTVAPIVLRTFVEWLRGRHFELEADRIHVKPPGTIVLKRPPELLDLAQGPLRDTGPTVVLHPDPELSVVERQVIRDARPRMRLATPSTIYRGLSPRVATPTEEDPPTEAASPTTQEDATWIASPLADVEIAVSLSEVAERELAADGLTADHLRDVTVSLARALLSSGAALAYGGDHRFGGYDALFAELVTAYNASGVDRARLLISYLSAFIPDQQTQTGIAFTQRSLSRTPTTAALASLEPPHAPSELSAARKALFVSDMRRVMSRSSFARVIIGGQTEPRRNGASPGQGYGGAYPGVVEEAWRALEQGLPLYIIGGFGGAARVVADALRNDAPPSVLRPAEFSGDDFSEFRAHAAEFAADADRATLRLPADMGEMASALRAYGIRHLATDSAALEWNGLDLAENEQLFRSQDPMLLTSLMMKGLFRKRREQCAGKLRLELVRGSITQADAADAVAIATFRDVRLGGAGAVLDRLLNSRLSSALKDHESVIECAGDDIDADWVILADLGSMPREGLHGVPAAIEDAAAQVAERAQQYGFRRVAVVSFCANVVQELDEVARRMLRGLRAAATTTIFQWFETDEKKFALLRDLLAQEQEVLLTARELPATEVVPLTVNDRDLFVTVRYENETVYSTLLPPSGTAAGFSVARPFTAAAFQALAMQDATKTPPLAKLDRIGEDLAAALFGDDGTALLARNDQYRIVLQHDLESGGLPFETLCVAGHRFSLGKGLVRRPALDGLRPDDATGLPANAGKIGVLLVINPLEDLDGAEEEAKAVQVALSSSVEVKVLRVLRGAEATKAAVLEALQDPDVRVFHYSGHAFFDEIGARGSGLLCADEERLTLEDLLRQEVTPNVAFFNACQSGRVRGSGLGLKPPELARAFAEYFLRSGVEAYLGTFWPVLDKGAATFATSVYEELGRGFTLDAAVREARRVLYAGKNPDWANYVLFGDGDFRLATRRPASA
jgi:hypothetical protein